MSNTKETSAITTTTQIQPLYTISRLPIPAQSNLGKPNFQPPKTTTVQKENPSQSRITHRSKQPRAEHLIVWHPPITQPPLPPPHTKPTIAQPSNTQTQPPCLLAHDSTPFVGHHNALLETTTPSHHLAQCCQPQCHCWPSSR